jgi:hypothetical protein
MIPFSIIFSIGFTFIWSGLIIGISFMEAWLKFQAPNVTMPIGLGIGKIVFSALNKAEWTLISLISICFFIEIHLMNSTCISFFVLLILIVLLQTFWLLPRLDSRADDYINGKSVVPSNLHIYYIFLEFIKLTLLITAGILQIKIIY